MIIDSMLLAKKSTIVSNEFDDGKSRFLWPFGSFLFWPWAMLKGPKRSFVVVVFVLVVLVGRGESWAKNVPNANGTKMFTIKIASNWTENR